MSEAKLRPINLVKLDETPEIIQQMEEAVKHSPVEGWNVVHWNRFTPDYAHCFAYDTETAAIRAFNTVTKMTSTLAACLREKTATKDVYVWML